MSGNGDSLRLITVARFDYPYQAHLALASLEAAGIPAVLADEHTIGVNMFYSQALGGVKLKVPEDRAAEALELLSQSNVADESEQGKVMMEQRPMCPRCGSTDISYYRYDGLLSFLTSLAFMVPFLALRERYTCRACGTVWRDEDE